MTMTILLQDLLWLVVNVLHDVEAWLACRLLQFARALCESDDTIEHAESRTLTMYMSIDFASDVDSELSS